MNLKKTIVMGLMLLTTSSVFAAERCYQISTQKDVFSRTPELLCVKETNKGNAQITLKTGMLLTLKTVATFSLDLLQRARCMECNQDIYGVANPSNSAFNSMQIKFNGNRSMVDGKEQGIVSIGQTTFFYRE